MRGSILPYFEGHLMGAPRERGAGPRARIMRAREGTTPNTQERLLTQAKGK
jgi:hypothetical protein